MEQCVMIETAFRVYPTPRADEHKAVRCPECGSAAEVEWRTDLVAGGEALGHLTIGCPNRHWFLLPTYLMDEDVS
jgi:hypothetical protein